LTWAAIQWWVIIFINLVTPDYIDEKTYKLNQIQRGELDSILLYKKGINLVSKDALLHALKPETKNYNRVKEIALAEREPMAIIALARYKNGDDRNVIEMYLENPEMLFYGVNAVKEFPDNKFYSRLVEIFNMELSDSHYDYSLWHNLFQALAQYPTQRTAALFEKVLLIKDNFRHQNLGVAMLFALTKYPSPIFLSVKNKVKLNDIYKTELADEIIAGR
jgi:hypothetical protein